MLLRFNPERADEVAERQFRIFWQSPWAVSAELTDPDAPEVDMYRDGHHLYVEVWGRAAEGKEVFVEVRPTALYLHHRVHGRTPGRALWRVIPLPFLVDAERAEVGRREGRLVLRVPERRLVPVHPVPERP